MKFTLGWLKDHLETDAGLDEILDKLTLIGLEVEEVVNPAESLKDFTLARVVEAKQHPNADKLKLCIVDTGSETVQVVCGAPNAKTGMVGVFAPAGTYVPGIDLELKPVKIRGEQSNGMLCSERELQLSDEHSGIIELPEDAGPIGARFVDYAGLADPVIEIAITPNRPDCLGVRGIARDLVASGLGRLKSAPEVFDGPSVFDCPVPIALEFDEASAEACPVFAGRLVRGLTNGPSPSWMQQRLRAIGLRPINALVDVTNYVSYDEARPLHVYDADKLTGTVRARLGRKDEAFDALDGKRYEVDEAMCVIADDAGVLGLGGVIGGEPSGSTETTTDVLIESAYFDPVRTAMTGRKLNIQSDARYRFERGIDPLSVRRGLDRATKLILDICGGEASRPQVAGTEPDRAARITFDPDWVGRLSGLDLKQTVITDTLEKLGFEVTGKAPELMVTVPSWRPDVGQPADLVEEVVRLYGVDRVPSTPMRRLTGVARPVLTESQRRARRVRRLLAGRGLVEAVTWSFVQRDEARAFGGGTDDLELANPISSEMSSMRPSLLPGLLTASQRNRDRGTPDVALFELGQAYRGAAPEDQFQAASGVRLATAGLEGAGRFWSGEAAPVDLYSVKADVVATLAALGQDQSKVQITRDTPSWFHPGRSGAIRLGPQRVLAYFGEFHPALLKRLGVAAPAAGFEIFLDAIPEPRRSGGAARAPLAAADLQPVRRDFAFLLGSDTPAGDVIRAARSADKRLITDVLVFDLFEGEALGEGKKSLAIEVTLQPVEKTLTDAEIDAIGAKVVAAVQKATGGQIRG